jgi:hypothetical protein
MDHGVVPISPLAASCAAIRSVGAGMILFNNTFFSQEKDTQSSRAPERLKNRFFYL